MNDNKYKNWWLYILKLESGKWYVGITSKTPEERFAEHLAGRRAAYWTKKYKPVEIELVEDLGAVSREHAEKYENKITRSLMKERGLNNVRGGDLRDVDDYTRKFGRYYLKDDWQTTVLILCLLVVVVWLALDKLQWATWAIIAFVAIPIVIEFGPVVWRKLRK